MGEGEGEGSAAAAGAAEGEGEGSALSSVNSPVPAPLREYLDSSLVLVIRPKTWVAVLKLY